MGARLHETVLSAAALAATVLLLGVSFLLILRTPHIRFGLRSIMLAVACIAVVLGLWVAVLRTASHAPLAPTDVLPGRPPVAPDDKPDRAEPGMPDASPVLPESH